MMFIVFTDKPTRLYTHKSYLVLDTDDLTLEVHEGSEILDCAEAGFDFANLKIDTARLESSLYYTNSLWEDGKISSNGILAYQSKEGVIHLWKDNSYYLTITHTNFQDILIPVIHRNNLKLLNTATMQYKQMTNGIEMSEAQFKKEVLLNELKLITLALEKGFNE